MFDFAQIAIRFTYLLEPRPNEDGVDPERPHKVPQFPATTTERKKDFRRFAAARARFNLPARGKPVEKLRIPTVPSLESFRSAAGNGLVRGVVVVSSSGFPPHRFYFPAPRFFFAWELFIGRHSDALVYYLQV